jgi:DNA gyrase subunit A
MRIVIELKRGELPDVVLNNLYQHTKLQTSYGITLLAIVGARPKVLSLLQIVELFIDFRRDVIRRRTEFELRKAERAPTSRGPQDRAGSSGRGHHADPELEEPARSAHGTDCDFGLTTIQAQAILDMQLQRLTGSSGRRILDELAELRELIEKLRAHPVERRSDHRHRA